MAHQNAKTREAINLVRYSLNQNKKSRDTLQGTFGKKKNEMAELMVDSNHMFEERDRTEKKIQRLQAQNEEDIANFEKEMEDMARYLKEQAAISEQIKNVGKDKDKDNVAGSY